MAKSKDTWNICDDFLDPLVGLLWQLQEDDADKTAIAHQIFRLYDYASLAQVWLEVHVSTDVANSLHRDIKDIRHAIFSDNEFATAIPLGHLDNLSAVLRPIVDEITKPKGQLAPAMTRKCIAEIFGVHRNAVNGVLDKFDFQESGGKIQVPVSVLPDGWREIYEKHKPKGKQRKRT